MDITKLKALTHKLVQLSNETDHMKGFLFNDGSRYFIKPIEVYKGTAKEAGKFYLTEENSSAVEFCESPKLMKVSMKSWHYRLMKYILRSNVPTPKTMQNGCPYFWLLIFCLLVSPFVFLGRMFGDFLLGFPYLFWKLSEVLALIALRAIPEEKAYTIDNYGYRCNYDVPLLAKTHFKHSGDSFMPLYIRAKYNISAERDPEAYQAKIAELKAIRDAWAEHRKLADEEREERERIARIKARKREVEREHRACIRRENREKFWAPFTRATDKMMTSIESARQFDYKRSPIIKRTKQFIGFIVSLIVLACTAVVVMSVGSILIMIFDGALWLVTYQWIWILYVLGAIVGGFVLFMLGKILWSWIENTVQNYKFGKKAWYATGFMYLTVYPIKYLFLGIFYLAYYVLWVPLKWIFYTALYETVLVNVGIFLLGVLKAFGGILLGSIGIFGEYFGASKKDYCPGLEWVDTDDE